MTTALALPNIARASLPATYERAKEALATCNAIDECKDWADKAAALASYAKQADDKTLHHYAIRISARAIRRCGELLKTFQTGPQGGRPKPNGGDAPTVSQRQAAKQAGLSKDQEVTAVRVANVPTAEFESLIESDDPPTVTHLAERGTASTPAQPGFIEATQLIGLLRGFASFCDTHPANVVALGVCAHEVHKIRTHIATIGAWIEVFTAKLEATDAVSRVTAPSRNQRGAGSPSRERRRDAPAVGRP